MSSAYSTLPQYYGHSWARPVAPRPAPRPYVPVRTRIAAPFLTAYAPKPEPVAAVPVEFALAFANLLRTHQYVSGYTRKSGTVVAGYCRRRPN